MPHDPIKLLKDIQRQPVSIESCTAGKTITEYQSNDMPRWSIERPFEIIGEGLARLLRVAPLLAGQISEHRRIIDFRNAISHGYDAVDDQLVWDAIQIKLPTLKREVESLLASLISQATP